MDVADPIVHIELEIIDLVLDVNHLIVFFVDKLTDFFKFELHLSHLLDPQRKIIDISDELLRIIG